MRSWPLSGELGHAFQPGFAAEGRQKRGCRVSQQRMAPIWGDFGQRSEHEGALVHRRVRQGRCAEGPNETVHGDYVEVEGARGPAGAALATERGLDAVKPGQQRLWRMSRHVRFDNRVMVVWLVSARRPGRGQPDAGARLHRQPRRFDR